MITRPELLRRCCIALLIFVPSLSPAVQLVASLPPVHSLSASVLGERGDARLLLRGGLSPHRYVLKPSDARALRDADLIVWVGPTLETFIEKSIDHSQDDTRLLTLSQVDGLTRWPTRTGGLWEAGHTAEEHSHSHSHPERGEEDPHYWLDPDNAIAWLRAIQRRLASIDPDGASYYESNARRAVERIKRLDQSLADRLNVHREHPFLVFHDAFQYLERRYDLAARGSISVSGNRPPGARRILAIRDYLRQSGARCLFSEPQFEPRLAQRLVEGTAVRLATLDPLGATLQPGPELYDQLLRNLGRSLEQCFGPG